MIDTKLAATEQASGLMSWTPIERLTIRIGTVKQGGDPIMWSEPRTDPNASLVPIDIGPVFHAGIILVSRNPLGLFDPMPVVKATFDDGSSKDLFSFYPDESIRRG